MGMHLVSQSTGEFIVSDLTKATIPLCWDDPTLNIFQYLMALAIRHREEEMRSH